MSTPALQEKVTLAPHTTFGIGGPADFFMVAQSADELVSAVGWARKHHHQWFLLGSGANILVGDKGYRGLVIKNEADHFNFDGARLTSESGATIPQLIEEATSCGLSGLEHYQDIPSTLGGAMWQNLHFLSYPHKRTYFIAEIVVSAQILNGESIRKVDRDYFQFGYDTSILHQTDDVVLEVTLQLAPKDREEIQLVRDKNAAWRKAKHPPGAVRISAGSIFQKIEGAGAGRLIDAAGLKGHRVGGAEVSPRHANYILNADHATAADVRQLIFEIQSRVKADSGYELQPEISFVGEF